VRERGRLLRLLFDALLGGSATAGLSARDWGDQLSLVVTGLLVGTPVWWLSWRGRQREALAPAGAPARQSLPRRVYLYLSCSRR